jgi:hypothetical protein
MTVYLDYVEETRGKGREKECKVEEEGNRVHHVCEGGS